MTAQDAVLLCIYKPWRAEPTKERPLNEFKNMLDGLPEQFTDPTGGLNRVQLMFWQALEASNGKPIIELLKDPTYKVVLALYAEYTGKGQSESRDKFLALKRAEQDFYRACAAEHAGRYRASQQTVDAAVLLVIDGEGNALPRAALLDAGVPAEEVARISGKTGSRRKVKRSLQKHAQHPNAQRMILNEGKREYMRLAADTLSGSLEGIAINMKTQARLANLEAGAAEAQEQLASQAGQLAALAARVAELECLQAFQAARNAHDDGVPAPKETALELHAVRGWGARRIAGEIGVSENTVKSWLRRT
jgi:DNA-binding NarL/FixJ family response regulator